MFLVRSTVGTPEHGLIESEDVISTEHLPAYLASLNRQFARMLESGQITAACMLIEPLAAAVIETEGVECSPESSHSTQKLN